jgi:hypothetical protein
MARAHPEQSRVAGCLHVEQEVDRPLHVMTHIEPLVSAAVGEPQSLEHLPERLGIGAGKLHELEAVQARRIVTGSGLGRHASASLERHAGIRCADGAPLVNEKGASHQLGETPSSSNSRMPAQS